MRKLVVGIVLSCWVLLASALNTNAKANIEVIATGGTIAGVASSQTSTVYRAGTLTAKQLINSIKGLDDLASLSVVQIYNKDSGNITINDWLLLTAAVTKAVNDPSVDGIVITHGTDTLEETAYFLNLVISSKKPIVLVGAMRAATAMSADGPLNLYNAIAVAANPQSVNRGVLVAMNEVILDAKSVTKTNTTSVETFKGGEAGIIGRVYMGDVHYLNSCQHEGTARFSINGATSLPDVAIIYEYVGVNQEMLMNVLKTKNLRGIVLAGLGDGNIPDYEAAFLKKARKLGIVVVRSKRVAHGEVTYDYNNLDTTYDLITAVGLTPEKARILLMLSLMQTNDIKQIQQNFYQD